MHKSKIVERAFKSSAEGEMIPLLPHNPTVDELEALGAQISLESEPHMLCDGCFWVSGEIPRKTAYEVVSYETTIENATLMKRSNSPFTMCF